MTSSVPAVQKAADELAKTVQRGVHLSALSDIDAFSAFGLGDILDYGLIDGLPALADAATGGGLEALVPADDGSGGYAALSGLNAYFGSGDITDIAAFSNGGNVFASDAFSSGGNLLATDAFSALPVFGTISEILRQDNVDGKALATALGGYDATSAANTFFGNGSNLTFDEDGVPLTTSGGVFSGGGIGALAPGPDGSGGYAALSALPAYAGAIEDLNPPAETMNVAPQNRMMLKAATVQPSEEQSGPVQTNVVQNNVVDNTNKVDTTQQVQPAAAVAPAAPTGPAAGTTPPASNNSGSSNKSGSYSGVFKPGNGVPILFGSGKGSGADNSIRGWGDMLKKAGLNGGESGAAGGAPAGGAAAGGTGEGGGTN